jgi:hypothetical protein
MKSITINSRTLRDGRVIPSGIPIEITFNETAIAAITCDGFETPVKIRLSNAYKWIKGFKAPPSTKVMERWMDDGIAKTVTGKRVEPDGIGPDGSPSYLIVLGLI